MKDPLTPHPHTHRPWHAKPFVCIRCGTILFGRLHYTSIFEMGDNAGGNLIRLSSAPQLSCDCWCAHQSMLGVNIHLTHFNDTQFTMRFRFIHSLGIIIDAMRCNATRIVNKIDYFQAFYLSNF